MNFGTNIDLTSIPYESGTKLSTINMNISIVLFDLPYFIELRKNSTATSAGAR